MTQFLIYDDKRDLYFVQLGIGIFWECGPRDMAKTFSVRHAAVKIMQKCGKHLDGWRVISEVTTLRPRCLSRMDL